MDLFYSLILICNQQCSAKDFHFSCHFVRFSQLFRLEKLGIEKLELLTICNFLNLF